ncbi:proton-conducting transporter membrane subunit [Thermomonospora sp. CIF 1]|uniref:proton-conducting transporter transmembrane domain-containing protein n=1 Tax=Thermomonospora sp. CIF 1 TaxID=1916083 RepID=UPI000A599F8B|nr:proton-conducting transporter membrane subunit [Thermomonospora sp. CIF 1]PKK13922.1 MAG: hypothetical protein BUE48_012655 [Thermomonospora sp. CIF 1]
MIMPVPSLAAALLLLSSFLIARTADRRKARGLAVRWVTAAAVPPGLAVLVGEGVPAGLPLPALHDAPQHAAGAAAEAAVICAAGLPAVAMAPLASHPPATLARILRLLAVSCALAAVRHEAAVPALWAVAAWLVWSGMRPGGDLNVPPGLGRLFAVHHVPGVLLLGAGTAVAAAGAQETGAALAVLGIMVRLAVIPVHGWYPRLAEHAPMGVVVVFGTIPLEMLTRLQPLSGRLPVPVAHAVAVACGAAALTAAALALVQDRPRRALAFLAMSQTGLMAGGIVGRAPAVAAGLVPAWQVAALALAGLAMALAALEARRGALSSAVPAGNLSRTPRLAVAFLLCGLAVAGFPFSLGFAAEHLLIRHSAEEFAPSWPLLVAAVCLNAMTVMRCFLTLFAGGRGHRGERDLTPVETYGITVVLAALLIGVALPVSW